MVYFYPQKHTTDQISTSAITQAQENRITEMLSLLDSELENKQFLVGDSISVCDYFLFMLLHWASDFNKPPMSFKNLNTFLRNMVKRDAVQKVCDVEGTSLSLYN